MGPGTSASWHLHPRPGRSAFINICINLAVLNLQQGNIRGGAECDDGPHCKQGQSLICWWQSIAPLVRLNTALYNVNPNNRIIVLSGHQLKITHYHINKSSFILTCHCSVSQFQSVEGCRSDVETDAMLAPGLSPPRLCTFSYNESIRLASNLSTSRKY